MAPADYKGWWHDTGKEVAKEEWGGWRAVTRGETTLGAVLDIECFDGIRKTILYSAVPLADERGDVIGAVIVNDDITERIRNEQELQAEVAERLRTMEELRRKDRLLMQQSRLAAMGEMIGNIAHQWRQPLNSLGLLVQGLSLQYEMGDLTNESLHADTTKAMQVISHMSRTIDDFRNFFRPDKAKVSFSVNEVVAKDCFPGGCELQGAAVEHRRQLHGGVGHRRLSERILSSAPQHFDERPRCVHRAHGGRAQSPNQAVPGRRQSGGDHYR